MGKNSSVIVPYDAELQAGIILFTANSNYDGGTGVVVDFGSPNKLRRVFGVHLQSRGTNVATLIRLHWVDAIGGIAPFCRDIKVPATTASDTEPLWSRTIYFRGRYLPGNCFLRAQTTKTLAAGISVVPLIQVMET